MKRKWPVLVLGVLAGAFAAVIFLQSRTHRREREAVLLSYQSMRAAVASGDTNQMLSLISPLHRKLPAPDRFAVLLNFLNPLDENSKIKVSKNSALVFPRFKRHYFVIPGGNCIELEKVDGQWLFTGKVYID